MMSLLKIYIPLVGFPIGIMCTVSLPLILLGIIQPDPCPWNWHTMYLTDFFFGLTLLTSLFGFLRQSSWGRNLALVSAGYAVFAFSQTALEAFLDMTGFQDAPITQLGFIFSFMLFGLSLGVAMIVFAVRYPDHWHQPQYFVSGEGDSHDH